MEADSSRTPATCRNRAGALLLALILLAAAMPLAAQPVSASAALPFTVRIAPLDWPGPDPPPALHSYAAAVTSDGRWLLVGGMTGGQHSFQDTGEDPPPSGNFPKSRINDRIWVVDLAKGDVSSRPLASAVPGLATSLTVTNPQGHQAGGKLYVVGGYGYTSDGRSMTTYPTLTVFDVDEAAAAVVNGTSPGKHIRQAPASEVLRVSGGELRAIDGTFYLVFGHDFEGFYTPQGNGLYTFQVRTFEIEDDGSAVQLANVRSFGSAGSDPEFRRRDLNVVAAIRPGGKLGLTVYGGVFTPQTGVWRKPVYIDSSDGSVTVRLDSTGFEQWMSQYSCANVPLWSAKTQAMHTVFFGGISEVYYHPGTGFNRDEGVPYIDEVSVISRFQDGSSRAYLATDGTASGAALRLPGLLGANALLLPASSGGGDAVMLDNLDGETLVGRIYGGIQAERGNGGPTQASNRIFDVYVTPRPSSAIPVRVGP